MGIGRSTGSWLRWWVAVTGLVVAVAAVIAAAGMLGATVPAATSDAGASIVLGLH